MAETVTVGTGTSTGRITPFNSYYNNGTCAMIYNASNFDAACDISSISFQVASVINKSCSLHIYLGVKSSATFSGTSDWPAVADLTEVYSNSSATIGTATGWETYTFSSPYSYNPANGNLVVVVCRQSSSYSSSYAFNYTSTSGNTVLYKCNDSDASTGSLTSVVSQTGTNNTQLPNAQFSLTYTGTVCNKPSSNPVASAVTDAAATLTWGAASGVSTYEYLCVAAGTTPDWSAATTTSNTSVSLTGLNAGTNYDFYVRSYCSASDQSTARSCTFTTECSTSITVSSASPWSENFDALTSGIPMCWDNSEGTTTSSLCKWNYCATGKTGHCLRFDSYSNSKNNTNLLATPTFHINGNMVLSFQAKNPTGGAFKLQISVDGGAKQDLQDIGTLTDWTEIEVPLSAYNGHNVVFYFHSTSNYGYGDAYHYLDDVAIKAASLCGKPKAIHVEGAPTTNSVQIAWNSNGVDPDHYELTIKNGDAYLVGSASTWVSASDTFYILSGLTPATTYNLTVSVRSACELPNPLGGLSRSIYSEVVTSTVSFRTDCAAATLPWSENFDGMTDGTTSTALTDDCWKVGNMQNTSTTYIPCVQPDGSYASSMYAHSAPNCLKLYAYYSSSYSADSAYAVLPAMAFNNNIQNHYLSFQFRKAYTGTTYNDTLYVGIVSDPSDLSTLEIVGKAVNTTTTYAKAKIPFAGYQGGQNGYVVLLAKVDPNASGTSKYAQFYVDDIEVKEVLACTTPTDVVVSNIATTTADLSWTGEAGANYTVYVSTESVAQPETETNWARSLSATTNALALTGLTPATTYYIYVRKNCADGDSEISEPLIFVSACNPVTSFPWTENFDSRTAGVLTDNCWDNVQTIAGTGSGGGSTGLLFNVYGSAATGGNATKMLRLPDMKAGTITQLTLPEMDIPTGYAFYIDVYRAGTYTKTNEGVRIIAGTDTLGFVPNNSAVAGLNVPAEAGTGWYTYMFPIPNAGMQRIILQGESQYGTATYMDSLKVKEAPTCYKPTQIHVLDSLTTTTTAAIAWSAPAEAPAQYKVLVVSNGNTLVNNVLTTDTFYVISGLSANTTYPLSISVNSVCDAGESDVVNVSASVRTECAAITSFPWTEDFESMTAGSELSADCWDNVQTVAGTGSNGGSTDLYFKVYNEYSQGSNATKMLQLPDMKAGTITQLTLPPMDIPAANGYVFSIEVFRNATGTLYPTEGIRVFADGVELGFISRNHTQTDGGVVPAEDASGWYTYEFLIPAAGVQRIMLQGESQYGSSTYMDNLKVKVAPTCYKPTRIHLLDSLTTTTTAAFAWSAPQQGAAQYKVNVKNGAVVLVNDSIVSDTAFVITGLTQATVYSLDVTIKSHCAADDESDPVSATIAVTTDCDPKSLGWAEGFESGTANKMPVCWQKLGTASYPYIYTYGYHEGSKCLYFYGGSSFYGNEIAVLPAFDFDLNTAQLRFWHKETYTTDSYAGAEIGVMSDPEDASTFVVLKTLGKSTTYTQEEINISADAAHTYLAIRIPSSSSAMGYYFDDFEIVEKPACVKPENIAISDIKATSAVLRWTSNAALGDSVLVKNGDAVLYYDLADADSVLISGLSAATSYTLSVMVKAKCSDTDFSEAVNKSLGFTTDCEPVAVFPWTEDFEGSASGDFSKTCFDNEHIAGTATYKFKVNTSAQGDNSTHTLYLTDQQKGNITRLTLPPFAIPAANAYEFKLDVYRSNYSTIKSNEGIKVLIDNDTIAFIPRQYTVASATAPAETAEGWYSYNFLIPSAGDVKIALLGVSEFGTATYLDNLTVRLKPLCDGASAVHLIDSLTTYTTATFAWSGNSDNGYDVRVFNTTDTITAHVNDTAYVLSGLQPSHEYTYNIEVVSTCVADNAVDTAVAKNICFTTQCQDLTIPYAEGFENAQTGSGKLPVCWSQLGSSTTYPYVYSNSSSASEGTNCLYFYGGGSTTAQYAVLPKFADEVDLSLQRIAFDYHSSVNSSYYTYGNIVLGAMSNPEDASTFVALATLKQSTSYVSCDTSALPVPAGYHYLAIAYKGGSYNYGAAYVDNIRVTEVPTCFPGSNLHTIDSLKTTSSVSFGWSPYDATNLNTHVVVKNGSTVLADAVVNDSVFTVTGLQHSTVYTLSVALNTICGALESTDALTGTLTLATDCDAISALPWSENFDNSPNMVCWNLDDGVAVANSYAKSGSYSLKFNKQNTTVIAALPEFAAPLENLMLLFSWRCEGTGYYTSMGYIEAGYVTGDGNFVQLYNAPQHLFTYQDIEVFFPANVPAGARIAFRYSGQTGYDYLFLDDVEVRLAPSCKVPGNIHVEGTPTLSEATIAWTANSAAPAYALVIKNGATELVNTTVQTTSYTLTGLDAATAYSLSVSVKALCSAEDESEVAEATVSFNTECDVITSFPWSEDFENYAANAVASELPCYSSYDILGDANEWFVYNAGSSAHGGSKCMQAKYTSSSAGRTIGAMELPEMLFENGKKYVLNYWLKGASSGTTDTIRIFVGSSELRVLKSSVIGTSWKEYTDTIVGDGAVHSVGYSFSNQDGYYAYLDDITISEVVPLTISSYEYATYYGATALKIPTGVEVFYFNGVDNDELQTVDITDVIPARTGVILYAAGGGTFNFVQTFSDQVIMDNMLHGTVEAAVINNDLTHYVLSAAPIGMYYPKGTDNNGVGAFTNGANKAYLEIPAGTPVSARAFLFGKHGVTTGVDNLYDNDNHNCEKVMVNGILYIRQNGRLYNAQGQLIE